MERPTLDFRSSLHLRVMSSGPTFGSALGVEPIKKKSAVFMAYKIPVLSTSGLPVVRQSLCPNTGTTLLTED